VRLSLSSSPSICTVADQSLSSALSHASRA
jgi:hypothetical protein